MAGGGKALHEEMEGSAASSCVTLGSLRDLSETRSPHLTES